ncbi:glycoside hydrolase family 117 protein [Agaribacterium haliotis]|uniref:glycoside hydrolase family 117 protein n=1 Tax=Agaribacterium haliotis TaxID=2013869 RepID=UPI0011781EE9|nr:family 43 glycosylhydrolase [Agaribacterium haliotis]
MPNAVYLVRAALFLLFCSVSVCAEEKFDLSRYSDEDLDKLALSRDGKLSASSMRALERGYHLNADWFGLFSMGPLKGDFAYDAKIWRRDPSRVLLVDGLYYTWYTRSTGKVYGFNSGKVENKVFPWDKAEIWYATSKDGWTWKEEGLAVGRGPAGAFDDRSVFTPEVMQHEGKFYLVYQAIKAPYLLRTKNSVAMAIADNARGPWRKLEQPILLPADNGIWQGTEDDHYKAIKQGDFDSHKVHDPTLMFYKDKFYLYYKGERMGERLTAGGREIRWGVAIADKAEGPYVKSEYNPITQSGHELLIWPYQGGMAMISTQDGPERLTMQWSPDGINFEIKAYLDAKIPHAIGLVESLERESAPGAALSWGLYHQYVPIEGKAWYQWGNYIGRFSFDHHDGAK